jgi:probable O-glycosylation ligase (exosortase A-associated)
MAVGFIGRVVGRTLRELAAGLEAAIPRVVAGLVFAAVAYVVIKVVLAAVRSLFQGVYPEDQHLVARLWLTIIGVFLWFGAVLVLLNILGLGAIGPFVFARMRYKLVLITVALLASGTIVALIPDKLVDRAETIQTYEEDHSAMQRMQAWGVAWNIAVENPLLGAGYSMASMPDELWLSYANFRGEWHNEPRVAHSNYFQVLGQHGFVGLGLYLALLAGTMMSLLRLARRARLSADTYWISEYAWALLVGLIGYSVSGAFLNLAYFDLFYAFVAVTVVLRREYAWALAEARDEQPVARAGASIRQPGTAS